MKTTVTEIARAVHRLSTFHPGFGIQFNQFLVVDEEPFLMHTAGMRRMFEATRDAVASLIEPARLPHHARGRFGGRPAASEVHDRCEREEELAECPAQHPERPTEAPDGDVPSLVERLVGRPGLEPGTNGSRGQ